jgi:hypothetical protein
MVRGTLLLSTYKLDFILYKGCSRAIARLRPSSYPPRRFLGCPSLPKTDYVDGIAGFRIPVGRRTSDRTSVIVRDANGRSILRRNAFAEVSRRRAIETGVHPVFVVTEDARELVRDVRSTVSALPVRDRPAASAQSVWLRCHGRLRETPGESRFVIFHLVRSSISSGKSEYDKSRISFARLGGTRRYERISGVKPPNLRRSERRFRTVTHAESGTGLPPVREWLMDRGR